MGKKRANKDRGYLTTKEWKEEWGGFKGEKHIPFNRLPFHCCAISFTPFTDPVCTDDGTVYDIVHVVPFVRKFHRHPVKGTPLELSDLITLNFHKNGDGEYCCPVTGKVFTEHTHIVAIRTSGNVYAYDTVQELNIKPRAWRDLITDDPFSRADIITIQDPLNMTARSIAEFDHVKRDLRADEGEEGAEAPTSLRNVTEDMQRALGALGSAEARAAFEAGGGGRRAEAARLLADARMAKGKAERATKGGGGAKGGAVAAAAADDGGAAGEAAAAGEDAGGGGEGGGDWRLRAPDPTSGRKLTYKPGASTWDTEDHMAPEPQGRGKGGKRGGGGGGAPGKGDADAAGPSGRPDPQAWYEAKHARYVESHTTTGAMARAFTSTVAARTQVNTRQRVRVERNPSKKGYVRLHTSLGDLNLELHCDIVPRTCENFLALCEMGYYDGVPFHRSIKNFMIQGGDPTGTGKGGSSVYGPTFRDEVDSRLTHSGRGTLSMANSGPNTNGSQFFILYKSARHLDLKHSVFGRVVGGLEVLTAMERTPTDAEDRPKHEIAIIGATIFTNPFAEMEGDEEKAAAEAAIKADADNPDNPDNARGSWFSNPASANPQDALRAGVGKYIASAALDESGKPPPHAAAREGGGGAAAPAAAPASTAPPPAKKAKAHQLANFDAW